jgi:hypothetical protein
MKVVDWLDDPLTEAELQAVRDPAAPGVFAPSKAAE